MTRRASLVALLIFLGLAAGVALGEYLHSSGAIVDESHWSRFWGELILLRPLQLLAVPLVLVSVITGVASIGSPSKLGLVGGATILYFVAAMLLAATLGAALVSWLEPGLLDEETRATLRATAPSRFDDAPASRAIEAAEQADRTNLGRVLDDLLDQVVPANAFAELAAGRTVGVILLAILLGLALAAGGDATVHAKRFLEALREALLYAVGIVTWLAPAGVLLLVASSVGSIGLAKLQGPTTAYLGVVLAGLAAHGLVTLPLVLFIFTRRNPWRFAWQMRTALLVAFGTASPSATLPVTIETAQSRGECSKRASGLVLPLGSAFNLDGTALCQVVAVVTLYQLYGIDLSFTELLIVVITATLAAIGAAGLPAAGLVTMVIVINAVNTSLGAPEKALPIEAIGAIIGLERIVEMCSTTINAWGNAVGAKLMTRIAPDG